MKILWVTNVAPASSSSREGTSPSPLAGWITSIAHLLEKEESWTPIVAYPVAKLDKPLDFSQALRDGHILFNPKMVDTPAFLAQWQDMLRTLQFEAVHLFGTELPHSLVVANATKELGLPLIVNIQGLVSVIGDHITAGLQDVKWHQMTLRSLLKGDSVKGLQRTYRSRGDREKAALRLADYVIGRTEWDEACARQLAPQASYIKLNETLREVFYEGDWDPDECKPFSIVMSQAKNPLKGLHFAVEMLSLVREEFPTATLTIAGRPPYYSNVLKQRLLGTQYGTYVRNLVKKSGLSEALYFSGVKSDIDIKKLFLSSNVFLSASSIENESNSLSEAKSLAMPCVASYVGGVASRIVHHETGYFYQHDAPYMAAYFIKSIFRDPYKSQKLGKLAQQSTRSSLSPEKNLEELLSIYRKVVF
ncbi:hypothetical protein CDES_02020 [Corynebacterium deserti GIMN1.010]|uniref:Glycosyl transferase family 1 domain-containing protein n=1 Tax=Corynebacterium deserti GIMN1.010 TaxID=931089 RepID=A0A0M4CCD1_9CORY|nr:glycosyltransferase [Corynebacterium deserti]ALC04866.1 hypothetical protein CDES_02020 [Corynebacterium deserti GIMN1.010]